MKASGSACDTFSSCDPYIKLFINDINIEETEARNNVDTFNANINLRLLVEIPKNVTLKIQVWDKDINLIEKDDLIQEEVGSIESFLQQPIRYGAKNSAEQNFIETFIIWKEHLK